jgi:hypothetical protein
MLLPALPILRVLAVFETEAPMDTGRFGVAVGIRGAFELALSEIACVMPSRACHGCAHAAACPVPSWLSPGLGSHPSAPRPYALRTLDVSATRVAAEWVFFGEIPERSSVSQAFRRMARRGLGANRVAARLALVEALGAHGPVVLWEDDVERAPVPSSGVLPQFARPEGDEAILRFVSPVQLQPPGDAPEAPTAAAILARTIERLRSLCRATGTPAPPRWPEIPAELGAWQQVRFRPGFRWSERSAASVRARRRATERDGHIDLSGWEGTLVFDRTAGPWADVVAAAEVLQVGRHTTEGLGVVEVDWR